VEPVAAVRWLSLSVVFGVLRDVEVRPAEERGGDGAGRREGREGPPPARDVGVPTTCNITLSKCRVGVIFEWFLMVSKRTVYK